jgi:hypothetical protein
MTSPFPGFTELRGLLDALCEESITAEQMRRLEELVLAHPEAEAYYVQYMSLFADLSRHFAALPGTTAESLRARVRATEDKPASSQADKERKPSVRRFPFPLSGRLPVSLSALAAGLLLALALWPRPHGGDKPQVKGAEPTDDTVALLLRAPGAEWEDTGLPTRTGAMLPPGRLLLKSGLAHIEFYSGATVILEGPAELQLISPRAAYCARGKLRATVPPQAHGFTIGTPKLDLVDRGTEFGLQVGAGDKTEVHVFKGKVELYDPGSDRQAPAHPALTTGQSVRLDGPGGFRPITSDPDAFRTLEEHLAEETLGRHRAWLAGSEAVRRDPSLLVYYTFQAEQPGSRTLLDQAGARRGDDNGKEPHDGVIVGCRWGAGRWPGKQGLEFKQVSDRVRFHVPGEFDSLTLMAWVRVDALPNGNNSLMMCDGWEPGGLHWQIGATGTLILGVQQRPKGHGGHYHAPEVFTPNRLGQWAHLAVVYDRDNGRVTHYIDGKPAAEEPLAFDIPLRVGNAELGNWNIAAHRNAFPIRYMSGCMDEFLLFARALGGQEIERLYAQGRPPL